MNSEHLHDQLLPIKVHCAWEEHSYLTEQTCEVCGDDVYFEKAEFIKWDTKEKLERLRGSCLNCGQSRELVFDVTRVLAGGVDAAAKDFTRAWPVPHGRPYPMAEQGLPRINEASETVESPLIGGRWAVFGARPGSMGTAFWCMDRATPGRFSVVKLPRTASDHDALRREISIYARLTWGRQRSRHVLGLLDVTATVVGTPWLVTESVPPGPRGALTVDDWLRNQQVDERLARKWIGHLACALHHCGQLIPGFVHGDLKPDNMLVDTGWLLRLFDFGQSGDAWTPAIAGAALYKAPEAWFGMPVTVMSDVYSFGCIAFELLEGRPPFRTERDDPEGLGESHKFETPPAAIRCPDFVLRCLRKNPSERPTFEELAELTRDPTTRAELITSANPERDMNDIAAMFISLGEPHNAMPFLVRLSNVESPNPRVLLNLATCASKLGLVDVAESAFEQCHLVEGDRPELLENWAAHRMRYDDSESAKSFARAALLLDAESMSARITLSAILNQEGLHLDALHELELAAKVDPSHPAVLQQFFFTCLQLKKFSRAKQYFSQLTTVAPMTEGIRALYEEASRLCPKLFPKTT